MFKTQDGGETWLPILEIDEDTGITSMAFAPDNPNVIYAAAYQRRRRVWSFVGGGPGSGIHKSTDGGQSWRKMGQGLPEGDMGKIGLAVTAADPSLVFATVEAAEDDRGFYRSTDQGESWEKRDKYISGGTGPHYYQEIFASPTDAERVYQVDVFVHVTNDGGKTFERLESGKTKHSDNHVVWIDPNDPEHLLIGSDAGLYETFDHAETFRHFSNMPISQFYRVALDNSEPFYNILGGAQDLGTVFGPSRTRHIDGVRNQDWYVPLGADGYHVAFDPTDPTVSYLEWQGGNVMRHDRRTMELQDIQPQPASDDPPERWNWDCPIVVSPHDSARIYVASQRVWRSDDRGDSWTAISGDLTRNQNRYELPTFQHVASVDSLYDHMAMSHYNTITHLSESPVSAGLLYAGTDDSLVQVSEDGGGSWRQCGALPDLPADGFVNDVEASQHDPDIVFVAADAHKNGDYTPYLYTSDDRGRTWQSVRGDLPDGTIVWAVEQDHVDPLLLFAGTEFGVYTSVDGGETWHKLDSMMPSIPVRELKLHRRDDDLVAATFGRGFFVLDDFSSLRNLASKHLDGVELFPVRDALWYVPYQPMQAPGQATLGSAAYRSDNPPFGATFTYHLPHDYQTEAKQRRSAEADLDNSADIAFPGWPLLWDEHVEIDPRLFLVVRDESGQPVRRIVAEAKAGLHRTAWDLRLPPIEPVTLTKPDFEEPWESPPRGPLVPPAVYTVELVHVTTEGVLPLAGPERFVVKPIPATERAAAEFSSDFDHQVADLARQVAGANKDVERARDRIKHLRVALAEAPAAHDELFTRLEDVHRELEGLRRSLSGDPVLHKFSEPGRPSTAELISRVASHHWDTSQQPTATQSNSLQRALDEFANLRPELTELIDVTLDALVAEIDTAGGPWTPR